MISCLNCISANRRRGVAFSMSDIYASISGDASSGSASLGEISRGLLALGLTVEAARNALNTVAAGVQGNPQQMAALNAELNYLNTYGARPNQNNWVLPAMIAAAILLWVINEKK